MSAPERDVYLADGFEPTSLRVPQLRSILVEHGIYFPSTAKKADLVALFSSQLRPRSAELLAAQARVRPSGRGIVAVSSSTGEETVIVDEPPVAGVKRGRGRPRKTATSVASDDIKIEISTDAPAEAPPSKKSRSVNVQPEVEILVQPPRKRGRPKKVKQEEEEPMDIDVKSDSEPIPAPIKTPGRRKSSKPPSSDSLQISAPPTAPGSARKPRTSFAPPAKVESDSEATPARKPRRSVEKEEESGSPFSDFNPFQSGSEQAAERERRRRKSSLGFADAKPRKPRPSEWTATSVPSASILRRVGPSSENLRSPPNEVRDAIRHDVDDAVEHNRVVEEKFGQVNKDSDEPSIVVKSQTRPSKAIIRRRPDTRVVTPSSVSFSVLSLLLLSLFANWKAMSSANGFCDTGLTTNGVIEGREGPILAAQSCIARRTQFQIDHPDTPPPFDCDMSALPLVPFLPRPTTCTPCPHNAICSDGEVKACAPEYILTPRLLSPLGALVDGWPSMPSRTFPPYCRPDTTRMRQIGQLAHQLEQQLARGRGQIECAGLGGDASKGVGERYGTSEESLRESLAERRNKVITRELFDEIFDAALKDLAEHGDIIESIDQNGTSWYAANRSELTVACRAKLEFKSLLERWKSQLASTAAVLALIAWFTRSIEAARKERKRVRAIADTVIARLQDQEYQHYSDPVVTPQPYLPPAQLRDVVLPASESAATRQRLWARVEAAIEKNANVQTRERELRGDLWKTWEWVGGGARIEPVQ